MIKRNLKGLLMKNTELLAYRKGLLFSQEEAARWIAVGPGRKRGVAFPVWQAWEEGEAKVPADVAKRVLEIENWRVTSLERMVAMVETMQHVRGINDVPIVWYSTLSDWLSLRGRSAILWRPQQAVVEGLIARIQIARKVQFDQKAYKAWLGTRDDSETSRAGWATQA